MGHGARRFSVPGAFGRNSERYSDPTASQAIYNITKEERELQAMESKTVIERGDIFYVESMFNETGCEQKAGRPAIVVSNQKNNEHSDTVEVVYLTTKEKTELPTHVTIRSAPRQSTALCEQISSVAVQRLSTQSGECTKAEMEQIDAALAISLGLEFSAPKVIEKVVEKPVEKIVEKPMPSRPDFENAYRAEKAEKENLVTSMEKKIVKAEAETEVYKKLYDDLLGKVIKN